MKNLFVIGLVLISVVACGNTPQEKIGTLYTLTTEGNGLGEEKGTITVKDLGEGGIEIIVSAKDLPAGAHGFHIHEAASIGFTTNDAGELVAGGQAKGHWDPDNTGFHAGPEGDGHRGDLYELVVAEDGTAEQSMTITKVMFTDITGKSIMIHAHGDNYSDDPAPLGGGGARMFAASFE